MEKIKIPIGAGWLPDLSLGDIYKAGGLYKAKNVIPIRGGYYPVGDKSAFKNEALADTILNGICAQETAGQYYNFVGTTTKLYRISTSLLEDITRASGGDYATNHWSFAEYGNWLIATNLNDDPQVLKGFDAANFAALSGSPPKGKFALMNSGHLILAHIIEDGVTYPKKIRWSAREDVEDWTSSLTTGSDSQNFPEMIGNITAVGSLGVAFVIAAEHSLTIGYYVGGTYTYNFKVNAVKNIGCYYPRSFISIGTKIFFWSKESIYSFDGESVQEVGVNVKHTIFTENTRTYGEKISVAHDKVNGLIFWAYPTSSSSGTADSILVYNYLTNKFTRLAIGCDSLFMGATGGELADDLTTTLIDDCTRKIDEDSWYNKEIVPMVGDTDYKVKTLTGSNLTAEIETGEGSEDPYRLHISKAYMPIEGVGSTSSVTVKHRYSDLAAQSSASSASMKSDGSVDLRTTNRRLAINFTAASFTKINTEIEAMITQEGGR